MISPRSNRRKPYSAIGNLVSGAWLITALRVRYRNIACRSYLTNCLPKSFAWFSCLAGELSEHDTAVASTFGGFSHFFFFFPPIIQTWRLFNFRTSGSRNFPQLLSSTIFCNIVTFPRFFKYILDEIMNLLRLGLVTRYGPQSAAKLSNVGTSTSLDFHGSFEIFEFWKKKRKNSRATRKFPRKQLKVSLKRGIALGEVSVSWLLQIQIEEKFNAVALVQRKTFAARRYW